MIKRINVHLDKFWQATLEKKTRYTSISLDAILIEALEKLENRKIQEIIKEIMEQRPFAHLLLPGRGLSHYIQAILIERLAGAANININLLAVSQKYQESLKKAKMEAKK
jgi:hypothetical protein